VQSLFGNKQQVTSLQQRETAHHSIRLQRFSVPKFSYEQDSKTLGWCTTEQKMLKHLQEGIIG